MLDTSSARDRDAIIDTPGIDRDRQSHRLQLVSASPAPLPDISGRRLHSVRFFAAAVELDFGAVLLPLGGDVAVSAGSRRTRYPDPGFRDAICSLIGARVDRVRAISGDRVEISYDNGCELTAGRTGAAVA
ncbi:MAG TPA: hypothetical protein VHM24_13415 [Gemmatimonadaceae bacterium]|nr:hypothetical protein [Gemmatimonadaceae bacterium]